MGLARTFAHAGRVVVLDDVAASLDRVTEHQIGGCSRAASGAHQAGGRARASTAARADLVVWLDGGWVRAVQPHPLLWADPEYRAVFGPSDPRVVDDEGDSGAGTAEEEPADVIRGAEEPADVTRGAA